MSRVPTIALPIETQIGPLPLVATTPLVRDGADRIVMRRIVLEINVTIITNRVAVDEVGPPDIVFERGLWRM